jgi:hypothetical protein
MRVVAIPGAQRRFLRFELDLLAVRRGLRLALAPEAFFATAALFFRGADLRVLLEVDFFAALPRARVFRDEAVRLAAWRLRAFGAFLFGVASRVPSA